MNIDQKRLFLGFGLNDAQVQRLTRLQSAFATDDFKPVAAANLHMTLLFLGNVTDEQQQRLQQYIDSLLLPRFTQPLSQLDFWPKPKILCLRQAEVAPPLLAMQQQIAAFASNLLPLQQHDSYRPHVTLARKAKYLPTLAAKSIPHISLAPTALQLYQSINLGAGVQYPILQSWPLRQ
ncbi:RNA 2',3'-cyclic phosphodiesterase [Shewanella avicenniae]|uniref:RNA 2',3'-cyclic phosphodiesterase n=1 Tax=Shewanella avicenniae TaxID=2814294 RepID=A0ABX7QQB8_9GAMM|nr:RNA 2',3'-cyclic phosphodiesterase [Shewanella avicenniae]QSX33075.1 RNA 2',3'-cyclic phosphodiesterase [Shewanella avicenniae]